MTPYDFMQIIEPIDLDQIEVIWIEKYKWGLFPRDTCEAPALHIITGT